MDRSPSGISPFVLIRHSVLSTVSSRYPELRGTYPYCPIPFAALGLPKEPCRSTCMPNPRRQRSFWARIKPFNSFIFTSKEVSFDLGPLSGQRERHLFWIVTVGLKTRRFLFDGFSLCMFLLYLIVKYPPSSTHLSATTGNNIAPLKSSSTDFSKNFSSIKEMFFLSSIYFKTCLSLYGRLCGRPVVRPI